MTKSWMLFYVFKIPNRWYYNMPIGYIPLMEILTMNKFTHLLGLTLIIYSCGESRVCNHNGTDVPCGYYDLYTEMSAIEAKINATFEDDAYFPFEEEYALREQWNALYNAKKDSLAEAYKLVGQSDQFNMLSEMRVKEMDYFNEQKFERAELQKFLPSLAIKAEKVDTSFWEGGTPEPTLMWTITNNSDKTFASIYIDRNIVVDGKIVSSSSTTYIFSNEQIIPMPKEGEEAHVKPGMSVVLSFDIPQTGEVQPEIASIGFVGEGE